jgi:DNA-directed RNA polymerase subunit M/transcription elongation factor TFIIS
MSKFCENCGAEMEDNETVCKYCGPKEDKKEEVKEEVKKETAEVKNESTEAVKESKPMDVKKIGIIAGAVALAVLVLTLIINIVSGGWKTPIDNYFKGMQKADAKMYLKAFPEFLDKDDTIDKEYMKDMLENLEDEYGKNIKIKYEVTKKEKIKKDDLSKVQEYIEKKYDEKVKVSAGYEVKVKATIKGKDDEDTDTQKMYVYKIDGKWKYFSVSPDTAKSYLKNK